jgi:hypothetical protein
MDTSGLAGGGLVVYGTWEAEVVIGGDLRLTGCSGGNSVGGGGGLPALAVGIVGSLPIFSRFVSLCR